MSNLDAPQLTVGDVPGARHFELRLDDPVDWIGSGLSPALLDGEAEQLAQKRAIGVERSRFRRPGLQELNAIGRLDLVGLELGKRVGDAFQPDVLDRKVFELHYLARPKNIKAAAPLVSVSRRHWYTLVRGCRRRAYAASREILAENMTGTANLPVAMEMKQPA
ncbi:hypothetical protein ACS5PM_18325 [Ideonella sp. YS5]